MTLFKVGSQCVESIDMNIVQKNVTLAYIYDTPKEIIE